MQVGYGDILPITNPAKFIAVISALCGLLVFGLPIPLIVQGFSKFYGVVNNKSSRVLMKAKGQAKTKREANLKNEEAKRLDKNNSHLRRKSDKMNLFKLKNINE